MSCLPGMPCYSNCSSGSSPKLCGVNECFTYKTTTDLVNYVGPNLGCLNVKTCETLTSVIEKIDNALCGENLANVFINTILTNPALFSRLCDEIIKMCIDCNYITSCIGTTTSTTTII